MSFCYLWGEQIKNCNQRYMLTWVTAVNGCVAHDYDGIMIQWICDNRNMPRQTSNNHHIDLSED